MPSESSKRWPYRLKNRCEPRSQRIRLQQLLVPGFELAEVFLLFVGELLEDAAAARVLGDPRAARVELQPAPLGGNRDAERVPREQQLGRSALDRRRAAGPARLAGAVDLQDALARREVARRGDLLEERLDVRAEKLERSIAGLADQMKVARVAIRVLEPETALAEVDLARDPRLLHPLERAVDGGAADLLILAADQIVQVVGGQMSFLAEEDIDDEVALAGAFAPGRPEAVEVGGRRFHGQLSAISHRLTAAGAGETEVAGPAAVGREPVVRR